MHWIATAKSNQLVGRNKIPHPLPQRLKRFSQVVDQCRRICHRSKMPARPDPRGNRREGHRGSVCASAGGPARRRPARSPGKLRRITHALVEDLDLVISSVNGMGMESAERGNTCYAAPEWQSFQAHLDASSCMAGSAACWVSKCRRPDGATSLSCLFGAGWAVATGALAQASVVRAVPTSFLDGARSGSRVQSP